MSISQLERYLYTRDIAKSIGSLRREWSSTLETGETLLDKQGSVGLILVDVINAIGLTADEQAIALGPGLAETSVLWLGS